MPVSKLFFTSLLLCAAFAAAPGDARADTFTILPGGELAFQLNATTQGSFRCRPGVPCSASGNSVTFGAGANTTTFTFQAAAINSLVGNISAPLSLGAVQTSITGTGFVSPVVVGGLASPLGFLDITLSQTSPAPATRNITALISGGPGNYTLTFGEAVAVLGGGPASTYLVTPTGPNPAGFSYSAIVFSLQNNYGLPGGGTTQITAQAGAVPEPATLALLLTGLSGVGAVARRRGKARRDENAKPAV